MNNGKYIYLAFVMVAVLSAAAGFAVWRATQPEQPPEQPALLILPEAREIPPFSLVDQDSKPFGLGRLTGSWSLLFFGFTHCPDVCPGALYDLQRLDEYLDADRDGRPAHQVVFFSVDPERDTPERLKDYTAYFSPDFVAVTGDHTELGPLTRKLGIAYRIEEHEEGSENYVVDHSASILLVNPEGRLHGVFPSPHDVDAMAVEMKKLMN